MSNQIQLCAVKQYVKISRLKIHPNNPRSITDERLQQLKQSIIKKGFYEPILVWKKGNVILSGNHRYMAAQELLKEGWEFTGPMGETEVLPVVIEDMPYSKAEAILFEANNHYSTWIEDKLKKAVNEAVAFGSDAKDFGFDSNELKRMLDSAVKDVEILDIERDKRKLKQFDVELKKEIAVIEMAHEDFTVEEITPESDVEAQTKTYTKLDDGDEYGYLTLPKRQIDSLQSCFKKVGKKFKTEELTEIVDVVIDLLQNL